MNYILFDESIVRNNLLPLTFTRPVADIRIGILTIREKWEKFLKVKTSTLTETYLSRKYPIIKESNNILINGSVCPNEEIISIIKKLQPNQTVVSHDVIIALHVTADELDNLSEATNEGIEEINVNNVPLKVNQLWDIFSKNEAAILEDFALLTNNKKSQEISSTNKVLGQENIFIEKGAKIECAILNGSSGPIYIGKNAEIMEGSVIRGP